MSIISVDCGDCYARAERFGALSRRFAEQAALLGGEGELAQALSDYSALFASLREDIRAATDIWDEFYRTNVRLD